MLTAEQLMAKLYELRKDFQEDDEDDPNYQALHHAFLFISYNVEAFKKYVAEAAKSEKKE
jgi:hypothetical protein